MSENRTDPLAEATGEPANERLARQLAAGDEAAARLLGARVDRILAFKGFGMSADDRRDLRQDVVLQVLLAVRRESFDFTQGFFGFVETVASRRVIDWRRSRRQTTEFDEIAAAGSRVFDRAPSVIDALAAREQLRLGRAVLARLDAGCRDLIVKHAFREGGYRRLADELGVSEGALRVRFHRCVKRARDVLRELTTVGPLEGPRA